MSENSEKPDLSQEDSKSDLSEGTESSAQQDNSSRVSDTASIGDQVDISVSDMEGGDDIELNIPMPGKNWQFNSFLVDLAEEINENELDKLKHMFIEEIGRRVLEKIKTARDLFDTMRQQAFLREDNLLWLQSILMKLKRPELIKMTIQYAEDVEDVIHFQPVDSEPVDGYRAIKVHVVGRDFRTCNSRFVANVRLAVSKMLFIPLAHVIVAGIEPSSSMLLTIWIPDMYADIFVEMLKSNRPLQALCDMDIDTLQIDNITYNITGIEGVEIVVTEEQTKLINVYQQLRDKTMQLDNVTVKHIETSRENMKLKRQMEDLETESVALRTMFYNSSNGDEKRPAKLGSQAAFGLFRKKIKQLKEHNFEKKIVQELLYANSSMITQRAVELVTFKIDQLALQVKQLQSQLIPLSFEVELYRINDGNLESMLKNHLQQLMQSIQIPRQKVEQTLTYYGSNILRTISQKIRHRERQNLEKKYKWKANDRLAQFREDPSLLLACLFYKEIETSQKLVDFNEFVENCLKEINRIDLLQKFKDMISHPPKPEHQQIRSSSASRSQDREPPSTPRESSNKVEKEIHEILEKVSTIYDTIQSVKNTSVPYGTAEDKSFPPDAPFYGGSFMSSRQMPEM